MPFPNHLRFISPASETHPEYLHIAVARRKLYAGASVEVDYKHTASFPSDFYDSDGAGKNKLRIEAISAFCGYHAGSWWSLSQGDPSLLPIKEDMDYEEPNPLEWGNKTDPGLTVAAPGDIPKYLSLSLSDLQLITAGDVWIHHPIYDPFVCQPALEQSYTGGGLVSWLYFYEPAVEYWFRLRYDPLQHGSPEDETGYWAPESPYKPPYIYLKDEWIARFWTYEYYYYRYSYVGTPAYLGGGIIPLLLPLLSLLFGVAQTGTGTGRQPKKKREG